MCRYSMILGKQTKKNICQKWDTFQDFTVLEMQEKDKKKKLHFSPTSLFHRNWCVKKQNKKPSRRDF